MTTEREGPVQDETSASTAAAPEAPEARIDIDGAMAVLGIGRAEVYRRVKDGALKAQKDDHRLSFARSEVEALAAKLAADGDALKQELARWAETLADGADPETEPLAEDAAVGDRVTDVGRRLLGVAFGTGAADVYVDPVVDGDRLVFHREGRREDRGRLTPALATELKGWLKKEAAVTVGADGTGRGVGHMQRGEVRQQFRVTVVPTLMGEHLHLRLFPATAALTDLGFESAQADAVHALLRAGSGVLLLADAADAWSERHRRAVAETLSGNGRLVVSLEHRPQFRSELLVQLDLAAEGRPPFADLWRAALAMDPDAIVVDELRDAEEARAVVDGAAGALILAQVMAPGAAAARARLVKWEVSEPALGAALLGVVERVNVRQLCPACRREAGGDEAAGVARAFEPVGCEACGDGYLGVRAVCGVGGAGVDAELSLTPALQRAVEAGETTLIEARRWLGV